eukprot:TRINITY_DN10377_c0_g1_i1.p3 TRINITY_DN10377_c0_g1~~TRINITY_DN10377_c0_g1_i1.p3  ORF type:complete len:110 (-),score=17.59 TRINITY_DN10377_c0_g1_i1:251-559(-)
MAAIRFPALLLVVAAAVVSAAWGAARPTMAALRPRIGCDPYLTCPASGECPDLRGEPRVCVRQDGCNPSKCGIDPTTCAMIGCTRDCGGHGRCVRVSSTTIG